ncbi:MAG: histidine kinase [Terrimicrobiaceae bacterium]
MLAAMDSPPTPQMKSSQPMEEAGLPQFLFQIGWMTFAVFLLSQAGGWFSKSSSGIISPIWPSAGFALAVALIYGLERAFPAVYLGTLASNLLNGEPVAFLYAGPVGYVLELVLSWALLTKSVRIDLTFSRVRDFGKFVVLGCLPGPLLAGFYGVLVLQLSQNLSASQMASGYLGYVQTNAFGTLVFCPFFLFVLRRQDFRPPTAIGRYELLGYSAALAGFVWVLINVPGAEQSVRFVSIGGILLLFLVVSIRFGLRTATLFQAMLIFLVPAFAAMVPARLIDIRTVPGGGGFQLSAHGLAFITSLGCLLVAAFRDELSSLRMKFALAMSSADLCVWDWSPSGWACHTPSWSDKFGLTGSKVISEEVVRGLVHPDDLAEFEENFRRLASSEIPQWSQVCRMRDAEGRWLWIQLDAKPVRRTADDEIAAVAGVMRDITGERQAVQNRISAIETEAQLRTLRSQINPHFLFNALNSVRALIGRQDAKAKSMITSLGSLLREVLAGKDAKMQSVEKEIEIVRDYLEVEAIRFGDRLRYRIECPPELLSQRVPGMLVLTLVENAVKHGVSKLEKGGGIEVIIAHAPDSGALVVFVVNDGKLSVEDNERSTYSGQGLDNTRERILLATEGRGSFEIHEIPGPRVEAIVLLPFDERFHWQDNARRTDSVAALETGGDTKAA